MLLVAFLVGVYVSFASIAVAVLSAAFLVGSLLPFWAPTRFELGPEGIAIFGPLPIWQRRPWAQFRAFDVAANGVLVSPFRKQSRLDNFRGVFLRTEANREAVVEFLEAVVGLPDRRDDRAGGEPA